MIKRQKFKPGEALPADEMERRLAHLNRMARGEIESDEEDDDDDDSDSDSDSDDSDEDSDGSEEEEDSDNDDDEDDEANKSSEKTKTKKSTKKKKTGFGELANDPAQAELVESAESSRLAVCNLDWDHLGAHGAVFMLRAVL